MAGVYGNRTHSELCSNPPLVLKTRATTRCANTPETHFLLVIASKWRFFQENMRLFRFYRS
jgi:hypothetical protein